MLSEEFYHKIAGNNINFLIGSGMSTPLYKTLSLPNSARISFNFSFEDVLTHKKLSEESKYVLYLYYYLSIIEETTKDINIDCILEKDKDQLNARDKVIYNYFRFIQWIKEYLANTGIEQPKRINIFTTNYDLLFERTFDFILKDNPLLWFNDGSRGFFRKIINSENYNINILHSGFHDNYRRELSLVNLYKLHGSVLWRYSDDKQYIELDENFELYKDIGQKIDVHTKETILNVLKGIEAIELDDYIDEVNRVVLYSIFDLDENVLLDFYEVYKKILIVNPNKGKFEETVFNQHYYQLLRAFSYELEKRQTTLVVFGFSFADEHIRSIVKRSLLNPELQVFIIPFSKNSYKTMKLYFSGYNNIQFIPDFGIEKNSVRGDFEYLLDLLGAEG